MSLKTKRGQLVVFPAWLPHEVTAHHGSRARVVISFNAWVESPSNEGQREHDVLRSLPTAVVEQQRQESVNIMRLSESSGVDTDQAPSPSVQDVALLLWPTQLVEFRLETGCKDTAPTLGAETLESLMSHCSKGCSDPHKLGASEFWNAVRGWMRRAIDDSSSNATRFNSELLWALSWSGDRDVQGEKALGFRKFLSKRSPRMVCTLLLAIDADGSIVPYSATSGTIGDIIHSDPRPGTLGDELRVDQGGFELHWRGQSGLACVFPAYMATAARFNPGSVGQRTGLAIFLSV